MLFGCYNYNQVQVVDSLPEDFNSGGQLLTQSYNIPAPDFMLKDINGNEFKLSEYSGTPVVLCFFASWNTACNEEFQFLSQAKKDFPSTVFYAISTQENSDMTIYENKSAVIKFAENSGLDLPVLFDADIDNSVYQKLYYVRALPATFIIDANGNIQNIVTNVMPGDIPSLYASTVSDMLYE